MSSLAYDLGTALAGPALEGAGRLEGMVPQGPALIRALGCRKGWEVVGEGCAVRNLADAVTRSLESRRLEVPGKAVRQVCKDLVWEQVYALLGGTYTPEAELAELPEATRAALLRVAKEVLSERMAAALHKVERAIASTAFAQIWPARTGFQTQAYAFYSGSPMEEKKGSSWKRLSFEEAASGNHRACGEYPTEMRLCNGAETKVVSVYSTGEVVTTTRPAFPWEVCLRLTGWGD